MPTTLAPVEHLEGLREAMLAFVRYAERAGLRAAVPSCPDWTVRDLVAHQGMVHRWAAALLRGEAIDKQGAAAFEQEGRTAVEPLDWLADGAIEVAAAVTAATEETRALVFLNDAPYPKAFWARRQCHETTVHAVDALAASLGRRARAEETWIGAEVAADGIDELLTGFLPRPRSRLRTEEPRLLVVDPDDVPDAWEVRLGRAPAVTTRHAGGSTRAVGALVNDADWVLDGPAVELYLRLWNRQEPEPAEGWRELAAVGWS